ncbi:MAG: acyl-CoA synthetase FdrA [Chloroflexi bacterium]|nr:acyl-CoA synthetase FdrA [Chloroflexota bacterium]
MTLTIQVRRGTYYDSVVLMQLQRALLALPGVRDAGVVMGTPANFDLLRQSNLLIDPPRDARAEDLIIALRADSDASAEAALAQIDALLARRSTPTDSEYRPRSIESAARMSPNATWVLVSTPGRYAARVARDALDLAKNVFLFSDNVPLDQEIVLKQIAAQKGLLVMGPDCGTAIISGAALGFANRVRRGNIGIVGAAGTGIQTVAARIHNLGGGISHALGTGSRDLSDAVGAITARQSLALLARDPATDVIVLISKPPSPAIAEMLLRAARAIAKPVVIDFIGYVPEKNRDDNLFFARTLSDAAELAIECVPSFPSVPLFPGTEMKEQREIRKLSGYFRALYSGGTLAYEAQLILRDYLDTIYSNAPLLTTNQLPLTSVSQAHTILDLGADEFTVGRLHPMLDNDLRIRRLHQEARDPEVAIILLDVVLGFGAHPDPARELAPAIADARATRSIEIVAVVIGTDDDPQNASAQIAQLQNAGARVFTDHAAAVRAVGEMIGKKSERIEKIERLEIRDSEIVALIIAPNISLDTPFAAINVGLESFYESLKQQNQDAVHVDWQPPAGGNEKMIALLEKLKRNL